MAYLGTVGQKISKEVVLIGDYEFTSYFVSWNPTTAHIYTMKDDEGNILVWKTSSWMHCKTGTRTNHCGESEDVFVAIQKGDRIRVTGTIKELSVYRNEEQTVLQRVKVELLEHHLSKEEVLEQKKQEQLSTIKDGDLVWTMPYKQYKEHYSDCETLAGSYDDHAEEASQRRTFIPATIDVIIREGRLKNSGVRGEHFSGYQLTNQKGQTIVYRAVSDDNALKRAMKEFPDNSWKLTRVFDYRQESFAW